MEEPFTYDTAEMQHMLETRTLSVWDHSHLDSALADYIRCEPHARTAFEQRHFRVVWEHHNEAWSWDIKQPTPRENPDYHLVHQAVTKYFHDKGRVRVGTFELPPEMAQKRWQGEQVAGWLYGKEIKELVRKVTGLVPGRRDGFLAQFMKARRSIYRRMTCEDRDVLERIATRWEILGPPLYIKKKQFQSRFAKACAAFCNMSLREFGVWPIIFFSGIPGMGIPANIHESLQVKSLAKRGLREFADVEAVLDIIHDYVFECSAVLNNSPDLVNIGRKKSKKDYLSGSLYVIDEFEDIVANVECSRLIVRRENLPDGVLKTKELQHILWQLVACAHNCNTSNPDLQPPWQALSTRAGMRELLNPACIPDDESVTFGYNLSHTNMANAQALIDHFATTGFLEFKKVWRAKELRDPLPEDDRWHMLRPDDSDCNDEQSAGGQSDAVNAGRKSGTPKPPVFGAKGPLLQVAIADPAGLDRPIRDRDFLDIEDPPDPSARPIPPRDPSTPAWCPPCAVPATAWARAQYVAQVTKEVGGAEMQAIFKAGLCLLHCPLVPNYTIPMSAITASKSAPTPPPSVQWSSERPWFNDSMEVQSVGHFLQLKPWTLVIKGSTIFSGYSQVWSVILAALTYARGRAHKDVLSHTPHPNWALSGQDVFHDRAKILEFDIPTATVIGLMTDLKVYLADTAPSCQYPGIPPSLLYARFDTRMEYLRCLLDPIPELVGLLKIVQNMPAGPADDSPQTCVPQLGKFVDAHEDIGSLWNLPRCGMPSAMHERLDPEELLADVTAWWTSDDLFCSEATGDVQTKESALLHLLQAGLLCQDLRHVDAERDSGSDSLQRSILQDDTLRQRLRLVIVSSAADHSQRLEDILADGPADVPEGPLFLTDGLDNYDSQEIQLAISVEEHDAQLQAESVPPDSFTRMLHTSLTLDSRNSTRHRDNAEIRKLQNKDNRQRTGYIHPPRPLQEKAVPPDLSFVNDVTLPDVSGLVPEPPTRRAAKPHQRLRIRSKVPAPRTAQLLAVNAKQQEHVAAKPRTGRGARSLKRTAEGPPGSPQKKKHSRRAKEPLFQAVSDDEQEHIDLDNISGNESDSSSNGEELVKPPPRPRPMTRDRRALNAPGISTSFTDADRNPHSDVSPAFATPPVSRGRRSSLKSAASASDIGDSGGPQTRARSRTVRFANAPPSAHTRSKSR